MIKVSEIYKKFLLKVVKGTSPGNLEEHDNTVGITR